MVKTILFVFILSTILFSQEKGEIVIDENSGQKMLVGVFERDIFQDSSFAGWFNSEYNDYNIDTTALSSVINAFNDLKIDLVMGTWCSDSRREVPRFYKIMDHLKYNTDKINLVMVNRNKEGLSDEVEGLNIIFVPTFVFYRNGEEIGRIIETPEEETLEKDLANIVGE